MREEKLDSLLPVKRIWWVSGKGGGDGGRYGWMEVKGRWYGIWASEIIFRFPEKKKREGHSRSSWIWLNHFIMTWENF